MFKPRKGYGESMSKSFRLPVELVEQLDKIACKYNLSLNGFVIQCLQYAIDNIENDNQDKKDEKKDIS